MRIIQQVNHVRGDNGIKARIGVGEMQDIRLLKPHMRILPVLLPGARKHLRGEVRRRQGLAALCNYTAEQPCAARAFQYVVRRRNQPRNHLAQLAIRFAVDAIRENVVDPCDVVPEHGTPHSHYFRAVTHSQPLPFLCVSTWRKPTCSSMVLSCVSL